MSDTATRYEDLVRFVVQGLIDTDTFDVKCRETATYLKIEVNVPEKLRGRVIGKQGRIAKSIRTVLDSAAIETDLKISFDILD